MMDEGLYLIDFVGQSEDGGGGVEIHGSGNTCNRRGIGPRESLHLLRLQRTIRKVE